MPRYRFTKLARKRLCLLLILIFLGYMGYVYISGYLEVREMRQRLQALNEEIVATEAEKSALREEIEVLQQEEYIEELARRKLGLVREDEILIRPITAGGE